MLTPVFNIYYLALGFDILGWTHCGLCAMGWRDWLLGGTGWRAAIRGVCGPPWKVFRHRRDPNLLGENRIVHGDHSQQPNTAGVIFPENWMFPRCRGVGCHVCFHNTFQVIELIKLNWKRLCKRFKYTPCRKVGKFYLFRGDERLMRAELDFPSIPKDASDIRRFSNREWASEASLSKLDII